MTIVTTHLGTIHLSPAQRALRAVRPSFRSIKLPVRFVCAPEVSVHVVGTLRLPFDGYARHIPVFVRQNRAFSI